MRIQKALAGAGVASRRAVEEMVLAGRITVNGQRVAKLPCFVDLAEDDVRLDGRKIRSRRPAYRYLLLNKPRGVVCTQRDPQGRPRACELIPQTGKRIYCAGRLDADSTGLVILTNDGELTDCLTHPRYGVVKTYVVEVDGRPTAEEIDKLTRGMYLGRRRTRGAKVKILRRGLKRSLLEIKLAEGRNRQVRRMLASLGHKVRRLKRVAIGPVTDKGLKIGSFRILKQAEVASLRRSGRKANKARSN
jgi:23S rRNA pseudouridine2605 synthase